MVNLEYLIGFSRTLLSLSVKCGAQVFALQQIKFSIIPSEGNSATIIIETTVNPLRAMRVYPLAIPNILTADL